MTANYKFHETFNIANTGDEYIDLSFYDSALDSGDLRSLDRNIARVNNNPYVADSIVSHEYLRVVNPTGYMAKTGDTRHEDKETMDRRHIMSFNESTLVMDDDGESRVELIDPASISPDQKSPIARSRDLKLLVNGVIDYIMQKYPAKREASLKMFAFMMVVSGADQSVTHPTLRRYINHLRQQQPVQFKYMHQYCGTQHAAKVAREIVREAYTIVAKP